ncbi:comC-alpha protein [Serratia phage vB_SspM_LC53]|nr:comC-alpha protein [Serratia phage vB_SspM_LC53]
MFHLNATYVLTDHGHNFLANSSSPMDRRMAADLRNNPFDVIKRDTSFGPDGEDASRRVLKINVYTLEGQYYWNYCAIPDNMREHFILVSPKELADWPENYWIPQEKLEVEERFMKVNGTIKFEIDDEYTRLKAIDWLKELRFVK